MDRPVLVAFYRFLSLFIDFYRFLSIFIDFSQIAAKSAQLIRFRFNRKDIRWTHEIGLTAFSYTNRLIERLFLNRLNPV